jgi:hypothetical protein
MFSFEANSTRESLAKQVTKEPPAKRKKSNFSLLYSDSSDSEAEQSTGVPPLEDEISRYQRMKHPGITEFSCPLIFDKQHQVNCLF